MHPPEKPSPPSKRGAEERRERIITATRALIAQHGFHGTGMAQIAKCSGVLVGQIYRDFASKEDLIAAIIERDVANVLDDPELTKDTLIDEGEQLHRWVRRFISRKVDSETRSIFSDILSEATRNPKISAIIIGAHEKMHNCLTRAAMVWSSDPAKDAQRNELADLILTTAGAIQHRQVVGLAWDNRIITQMLNLVDAEIAQLRDGA